MEQLLVSFHLNDVGVEGLTQKALSSADRVTELQNVMKQLDANEVFYLSTCNRTEFLFSFETSAPAHIREIFGPKARIFSKRKDIIQHLLDVTLSKDSVVFGESQILGQFKRAYEQALEYGVCGTELSPLLNAVIREAKAIRSQIGLTQVHTSVSTVAGAKIATSLKNSLRVLFIGSGETNCILAKYLKKRDRHNFIWSSRGHQRAVLAAAELGGEVLNWDLIAKGLLPSCDVICVATHAKQILVNDVGLLNANPKMICDLSVPANVSQEATSRLGILYFGIEQLSQHLAQSQMISQDLLNELGLKISVATEKIDTEMTVRISKRLLIQSFALTNKAWEKEIESLLNDKLPDLTVEQKAILYSWSKKFLGKINSVKVEGLRVNVS